MPVVRGAPPPLPDDHSNCTDEAGRRLLALFRGQRQTRDHATVNGAQPEPPSLQQPVLSGIQELSMSPGRAQVHTANNSGVAAAHDDRPEAHDDAHNAAANSSAAQEAAARDGEGDGSSDEVQLRMAPRELYSRRSTSLHAREGAPEHSPPQSRPSSAAHGAGEAPAPAAPALAAGEGASPAEQRHTPRGTDGAAQGSLSCQRGGGVAGSQQLSVADVAQMAAANPQRHGQVVDAGDGSARPQPALHAQSTAPTILAASAADAEGSGAGESVIRQQLQQMQQQLAHIAALMERRA